MLGRERLCRYLNRPAFSLARLRAGRDGNVSYRVIAPRPCWRDRIAVSRVVGHEASGRTQVLLTDVNAAPKSERAARLSRLCERQFQ